MKVFYLIVLSVLAVGLVSAGIFDFLNGDEISIDYKDSNMTIEFKDGTSVIGEATLKSHTTYDEVLEVVPGKNKTVIWYEFSDFKDIQENALIDVEFIDMREMIENKSYTKLFDGNFEEMNESLILIKNPNYLSTPNCFSALIISWDFVLSIFLNGLRGKPASIPL